MIRSHQNKFGHKIKELISLWKRKCLDKELKDCEMIYMDNKKEK